MAFYFLTNNKSNSFVGYFSVWAFWCVLFSTVFRVGWGFIFGWCLGCLWNGILKKLLKNENCCVMKVKVINCFVKFGNMKGGKKSDGQRKVVVEVPVWLARMVDGEVCFDVEDLILYSAFVTVSALHNFSLCGGDVKMSSSKSARLVLETIRVLEKYEEDGASLEDVRAIATTVLTVDEFQRTLERLLTRGDVYSPRKKRFKLIT